MCIYIYIERLRSHFGSRPLPGLCDQIVAVGKRPCLGSRALESPNPHQLEHTPTIFPAHPSCTAQWRPE